MGTDARIQEKSNEITASYMNVTAETVSPRLHNFASFAEQPMEES